MPQSIDLKPGDRIEMWDDGIRRYSVVEVGRVWVTLLDTTRLSTSRHRMAELVYSPAKSHPRTVRRIIRTNLAERRKLGLRYAAKAAKTVATLLEQPR